MGGFVVVSCVCCPVISVSFKISDIVSSFIITVPLSHFSFGPRLFLFFIIHRSLAQSISVTTCIVNGSFSVDKYTNVTLTFPAVAVHYIS